MKKTIIYLCLLLLAAPCKMLAQNEEEGPAGSQVEGLRVGVYTRVLNLTSDEATKFWPVFNEMQAQIQKVRDEEKELRKNLIKNYQTASDAEVQKTIDRMFDLEQSVLDIKRKYYKEFAKVIPVKKVALIPKADREFQQEVLKRMRQMRNNGGQ